MDPTLVKSLSRSIVLKHLDSRQISGIDENKEWVDSRLKNFGNKEKKDYRGKEYTAIAITPAIVYNNTLAQKIVEPKEGENYHDSAVNYIWPELQKPSKS